MLLIYLFVSMVIVGWQFWSFIIIYTGTQQNLIPVRLEAYMQNLPVFLLPGMLVTMISGIILISGGPKSKNVNSVYLKYNFILLAIYFATILIDYLLFRTDHHHNIFELIIAVIAMGIIYIAGMMHLKSDQVIYLHPTLMGSQFVHTVLAGLAAFILFSSLAEYASFRTGWMLLLIFLDMFIVFGHFRFLSAAGDETRMIARQLLSRYIFIFGARLIVGIFIPLVLVIYTYFSEKTDLRNAAALILIGIFLQRAIFIIIIGHKGHREF